MAKTKFFRIAVEGATAYDGRVIKREWIDQTAANYIPRPSLPASIASTSRVRPTAPGGGAMWRQAKGPRSPPPLPTARSGG